MVIAIVININSNHVLT